MAENLYMQPSCCSLDAVIAERDQLRAEVERLRVLADVDGSAAVALDDIRTGGDPCGWVGCTQLAARDAAEAKLAAVGDLLAGFAQRPHMEQIFAWYGVHDEVRAVLTPSVPLSGLTAPNGHTDTRTSPVGVTGVEGNTLSHEEDGRG